MRKMGWAMAAGLAFWVTPAAADTAYEACNARGKTNADYRACGAAMIARREAALNREWAMRYAGLGPKTKPLVLAEQRLWIAFKDKSCLGWASGDYGTMGSSIEFYLCREKVIDARIGAILAYSEWGGD